LNDQPDRAFYGLEDVQRACDAGAVSCLLVSDTLLRRTEVEQRKQVVALVEGCKRLGAEVHVLSSLHVSGEQLAGVTGVACVTRFPCDFDDDQE
jgi:protein pelota